MTFVGTGRRSDHLLSSLRLIQECRSQVGRLLPIVASVPRRAHNNAAFSVQACAIAVRQGKVVCRSLFLSNSARGEISRPVAAGWVS